MKKTLSLAIIFLLILSLISCDIVNDLSGFANDFYQIYDTTIDINYPSFPREITFTYDGEKRTTCTIDKATQELSIGILTIKLYGTKISATNGHENTACVITWKLVDSDNYMVANGRVSTPSISVNEKFVEEITIYDIDTNGVYTLQLLDSNY